MYFIDVDPADSDFFSRLVGQSTVEFVDSL